MRFAFLVLLCLTSSGASLAVDPFRATCKIKHIWRNYETTESKTIESYNLTVKFMEDDDKYKLMGVPHVPMHELPWLFFFRHTLSGPIGQPTNVTPAGLSIWRRLPKGHQVNTSFSVDDLELGVPISGQTTFPEIKTSKGTVNGVIFSCVTHANP